MKNAAKFIEKQKKDEIKRQKNKIVNDIYPLLIEEGFNITEAKQFLQINSMTIQQAFDNLKLKMKVVELGLIDMLADTKHKEKYLKILALLEKESVAKAIGMLNETYDAIDVFIKQENEKRKLEDLKTDFII